MTAGTANEEEVNKSRNNRTLGADLHLTTDHEIIKATVTLIVGATRATAIVFLTALHRRLLSNKSLYPSKLKRSNTAHDGDM